MDDEFWKGQRLPRGRILLGRLGEENPNHPGTYRFSSTDGFSVPDAHILSPDVDVEGNGETTKPRIGSTCVAVMTSDGAACFVVGFQRVPQFSEDSDDAPAVGNPDDNSTSGDKVYQTAGGARLILKRGGAVVIEGGAGTGVILNPVNNQMTMRAANVLAVADGYRARRGRKEVGSTDPETVHEEDFLHQVGPSFDRARVRHGDLDGDGRREFTLSAVTVVRSSETAVLKTRETYYADGSWQGDGPKYSWGAGDEAAVLGNALVDVFKQLFSIIKQLKVGTAWGPSTPPLPPTPIDLQKLESELSGKILSTFLSFSKDPTKLG